MNLSLPSNELHAAVPSCETNSLSNFTDPEGLLPYSQELVSGFCPLPHKSSPIVIIGHLLV